MNMKMVLKGLLASIALGVAANANAVPVTFDLAGEPTSYVDVGALCAPFCGVSAELNNNLGSLSTSLSAGNSWTFDFFTLDFWGVGIGTGVVNAFLGFDLPTGAPGAGGTAFGIFATGFFGTGGTLLWDQPGQFLLGDGTAYSVTFENLLGITGKHETVSATIALLKEPKGAVGVPEPAMLGLFGLGLLGIGFARRKRAA